MNKLSIGKMAKFNNVTVETLRHYDKIGLLKPNCIDETTGYRYYSIKQSAVLDMIIYMKALGMPLETIKEQFDKEDVEVIKKMLYEQNRNINEKIAELFRMKNAIEVCIENYNRYSRIHQIGKVELQRIKNRKLFCYDGGKNIYEHTLEGYEFILRELKDQVVIRHLPMIYFCNVGTILRKKMIDKGKMISTELFLFVDEDYEDNKSIEYIPENDYLCIYCPSFDKEIEYAQKLFRHIKDNRYEIVGDYICEVVVELPIFDNDERNMFLKLQIPVKKH